MKKKKNKTVLWAILTGVSAIMLGVSIVGSWAANQFGSSAINMMFGTSNFKKVTDPDAKPQEFYKTDYTFERNGKTMYEEDVKAIEETEKEGAILLWNNRSALPLSGGEKVSLLSHSSTDIVECGSGSGYVVTYNYNSQKQVKTTMKSAFESRGFKVNPTLWDFYTKGKGSSYQRTNPKGNCTPWQQWKINEAPYSEFTDEVKNSFQDYGDVAIITLSRSGGEYSDLHYNYTSAIDKVGANDSGKGENTSEDGGYLGLSDEEISLLENASRLRKNGTFKKVVVLINSGNPLQMQDLEPYYEDIDSCMWIGQPGSTGINAVVDLLKGKDMSGNQVSPSAHLSDTWAYNLNSAPATINDGNYTYENSNLLNTKAKANKDYFDKYMVYQEGIYVGYRYYETRYADAIRNEGNAKGKTGAKHSEGNWDYSKEVAFPFGYGLSYATFEYSDYTFQEKADSYVLGLTVKNTSDFEGKDVVQAYLSKPYTDYDIDHEIEKSQVELVGYHKTKQLKKNESEKVEIEIPKEEMKTFDSDGHGTYILEKGNYYFTLANDAHEANNNILTRQGESIEKQMLFGSVEKESKTGADFVSKVTVEKDDFRTYSKSTQTGKAIESRLDEGDINRYSNAGDNSVTYLSRSDWEGTYPKSAPVLKLNTAMAMDLDFDIVPDDSDYTMPNYGVFKSGSTTGMPDVDNGDLVAFNLMDAPLNPLEHTDQTDVFEDGKVYSEHYESMWNQLLDQMTFEEQAYMIVNSYHWIHGANSIALPETRQENGPVGITKRLEAFFSLPNDDTIKGENGTDWTWVAYPCAGIIAASFNNDIARMVGEHKSEDMLYLGYNGIYGPGVNMHRSPFGGRAFEYPSEDPFLAGHIEANETLGIESKGCLAYAKHFALNDFETNRVNCGVWSTEQASREIYLKAFEIVFTEGKASATMNSYTRIGTKWNGACSEVMTDILREEWGYEGLVISDWDHDGSAMSKIDGVLAGTDTFDGNKTAQELVKYKDNAAVCQAMRTSARRIIYNVIHTNAMNGMTSKTMMVRVTPWWQTALVILQVSFGVITATFMGLLIFNIIQSRHTNGQKKEETKE